MADLPDITASEIKQFRASQGLTQEALARHIGVSTHSIPKWEKIGAPGHWRWAFAAIAAKLKPWRPE